MRHDPGYKLLFAHARMVEDLLRGFVPEDWVGGLDFTTLERVNTSTVSDDLRERHNDIIWRVRWCAPDAPGDPRWLYVYLMLEFQSRVDPWMAVRVLTYVGLLYQDLIRQGMVQTGSRLPPVVPILLYNGDTPWDAAADLDLLLEPVPGLERYRPRMHYLLLDERRYDEAALNGVQGLAQALFRLERSQNPEAMVEVLAALVAWLDAPGNGELRRAFAEFLRQVLLPARLPGVELPVMTELSEVKAMLSERVKEWTEQWKQQGLQQGLQQGRQEEREASRQREADLILRQIQRRVGVIPAMLANRVRELPLERIESLGDALLDFDNPQDLETWLSHH